MFIFSNFLFFEEGDFQAEEKQILVQQSDEVEQKEIQELNSIQREQPYDPELMEQKGPPDLVEEDFASGYSVPYPVWSQDPLADSQTVFILDRLGLTQDQALEQGVEEVLEEKISEHPEGRLKQYLALGYTAGEQIRDYGVSFATGVIQVGKKFFEPFVLKKDDKGFVRNQGVGLSEGLEWNDDLVDEAIQRDDSFTYQFNLDERRSRANPELQEKMLKHDLEVQMLKIWAGKKYTEGANISKKSVEAHFEKYRKDLVQLIGEAGTIEFLRKVNKRKAKLQAANPWNQTNAQYVGQQIGRHGPSLFAAASLILLASGQIYSEAAHYNAARGTIRPIISGTEEHKAINEQFAQRNQRDLDDARRMFEDAKIEPEDAAEIRQRLEPVYRNALHAEMSDYEKLRRQYSKYRAEFEAEEKLGRTTELIENAERSDLRDLQAYKEIVNDLNGVQSIATTALDSLPIAGAQALSGGLRQATQAANWAANVGKALTQLGRVSDRFNNEGFTQAQRAYIYSKHYLPAVKEIDRVLLEGLNQGQAESVPLGFVQSIRNWIGWDTQPTRSQFNIESDSFIQRRAANGVAHAKQVGIEPAVVETKAETQLYLSILHEDFYTPEQDRNDPSVIARKFLTEFVLDPAINERGAMLIHGAEPTAGVSTAAGLGRNLQDHPIAAGVVGVGIWGAVSGAILATAAVVGIGVAVPIVPAVAVAATIGGGIASTAESFGTILTGSVPVHRRPVETAIQVQEAFSHGLAKIHYSNSLWFKDSPQIVEQKQRELQEISILSHSNPALASQRINTYMRDSLDYRVAVAARSVENQGRLELSVNGRVNYPGATENGGLFNHQDPAPILSYTDTI